MKTLMTLIFLINIIWANAQVFSLNLPKFNANEIVPVINYSYAGGNILSAGVQYPISSIDDSIFFLGAGYGAYFDEGKIKGLPHWHLEYLLYNNLTAIKIEGSHQHINPSIGLSLFAFGELTLGYSVPFKNEYPFKGFSVGVLIRPRFIFKNM